MNLLKGIYLRFRNSEVERVAVVKSEVGNIRGTCKDGYSGVHGYENSSDVM